MNMSTTERTLFVAPVSGRIVPDPAREGADLPAEGGYVLRSPYWLRAVSAGDVVEVEPQALEVSEMAHSHSSNKTKGNKA